MNIDFYIPRPGDKYVCTPRDLNIKATYYKSENDEFESIEYDYVKDVTGFDWLPWSNDVFVAYVDKAVKHYIDAH